MPEIGVFEAYVPPNLLILPENMQNSRIFRRFMRLLKKKEDIETVYIKIAQNLFFILFLYFIMHKYSHIFTYLYPFLII